ncbi:hypothetical protein [Salinisphaera sp.]|uniref:PTS sugar transporter subunit IIA n=1 Tax=Salinisphaera sp. TaxID=1914330 RepID=UPI002D781C52|nr:hypothetical protein [Salinisphaera sp.]HET7315287.1 hypothetical protein [Salinisphaera sp.]
MNAANPGRVGVLLVGHAGLPEALLRAAEHIRGGPDPATRAVGIDSDADIDAAQRRVAEAAAALDTGAGVLILIDIMGATPYRIAHAATQNRERVALVTGAALAMLVRIHNYPDLGLDELADAALAAGRRSAVRVR